MHVMGIILRDETMKEGVGNALSYLCTGICTIPICGIPTLTNSRNASSDTAVLRFVRSINHTVSDQL